MTAHLAAPDTSVIVAAFASWHESHDAARKFLDRGAALIGHCALETYSVLTRLPPPHRSSPGIVAEFLSLRFPGRPLVLPAAVQARLVPRFAADGISGGAVYDGLVAATAAHHHALLLTLDSRAESTYGRLGVAFQRIS